MPAQFNIAVPANAGAIGASVGVQNQPTLLSVINPFSTADDSLVLQASFDNVHFFNLASLVGGPQLLVVDFEGLFVQVLRQSGSGGAYNIQAAGQGLGNAAQFNLAVPAAGASLVQDISGQPPNLSLFYDSADSDFAQLQCAFDNANFVPFAGIQGKQQLQAICGCNQLKAVRLSGGNVGTLRGSGLPAK